MLTGNNGILTQAKNAKTETDKAGIIEDLRLKILEKQTDGEPIYKEDIETILNDSGYFTEIPEDITLDTELTTTEENGDYTIKVSEIYNGELKDKPILAGGVLEVNTDTEVIEPKEKSPFVEYNGILCRVLYNDATHGLQIVSADNIEGDNVKIILGWGNTTLTGVTGEFNIAMESYNKAIDILNNKSKEYMNENAIDARSLGSIATIKDGKFQGDTSGMYSGGSYLNAYEFKDADTNYEEDVNQIKVLGLNATGNTWLASRNVTSDDYRY